jgi:hypoxanthine-guanine phosphoribosyltransferase
MELLNEGRAKEILIVDDINDTGATFNWIMEDWPSGCLPNDPTWKKVWNNNVKFAVVVDNLASQCNVKMDFVGMEINKAENDVWVDFPWEDWWQK